MKFLSLIICFLCALSLWADAVIVIKGKEKRSSIKIEDRTGLTARVRRYNTTTEVGLRPRKKFQSAKLTFKVLHDDEYTFTFGGGYTRAEGDRKDVFEWVDCTLFRVNGKDLIGPKVEKGGQKSETLSRPKAVKGSVKLKKGAKLIIEVTLRSTPKKEAKKRSAEGTMSKRQKERLKREEAKDKARKAEAEREEKARKAADEASRKIIEKRFGIKQNKKEESGKKSAKDAAPSSEKKAPEAPAEEAPEEGGNQ
ncbi:MAG: hypothetical protein IJV93_07280 [Lentisphaeria bacterium]|nr:hypothetical protein [Lentisphaeria bacterium]